MGNLTEVTGSFWEPESGVDASNARVKCVIWMGSLYFVTLQDRGAENRLRARKLPTTPHDDSTIVVYLKSARWTFPWELWSGNTL